MLFSRRTEYALRALGELAGLEPDGWVMLDALIQDESMPRDFLAKVFQRLVRAGLLKSSKGRGGGFALARDAGSITLMDVLVACEGPQPLDRCVVRFDACNDMTPCPQHDVYKPIRQRLRDYLTTTTLADLAVSLRQKRLAIAASGAADATAPALPPRQATKPVVTVPLTVVPTPGGAGLGNQ